MAVNYAAGFDNPLLEESSDRVSWNPATVTNLATNGVVRTVSVPTTGPAKFHRVHHE